MPEFCLREPALSHLLVQPVIFAEEKASAFAIDDGRVEWSQGMKESYTKYRVHLLERLKVDSAGGRSEQANQGNGGRQAGQLLLLLLLGALITIAYLVRCTSSHSHACRHLSPSQLLSLVRL